MRPRETTSSLTLARFPSLLPTEMTESLGDSAETLGRRVLVVLWVELPAVVLLSVELVDERVEFVVVVELKVVEDDEEGAVEVEDVVDEDEGVAEDVEVVDGAAEDDDEGDGLSELELGGGGAAELGGGVQVLVGVSDDFSGVQVLVGVGSGVQVDVGVSFFVLGLGGSSVEGGGGGGAWLCWPLSPPLSPPPPDPSFQLQDIWKRPTSFELNFSNREGDMSSEP